MCVVNSKYLELDSQTISTQPSTRRCRSASNLSSIGSVGRPRAVSTPCSTTRTRSWSVTSSPNKMDSSGYPGPDGSRAVTASRRGKGGRTASRIAPYTYTLSGGADLHPQGTREGIHTWPELVIAISFVAITRVMCVNTIKTSY